MRQYDFKYLPLLGAVVTLALGVVSAIQGSRTGVIIPLRRKPEPVSTLEDFRRRAVKTLGSTAMWLGQGMDTVGDSVDKARRNVAPMQSIDGERVLAPIRSATVQVQRQSMGWGAGLVAALGAVIGFPGLLLRGIFALLWGVVSTVFYLMGAAMWIGLMGAFILFVFAPLPEQRQAFYARVQNYYAQAQTWFMQAQSYFDSARQSLMSDTEGRRAA